MISVTWVMAQLPNLATLMQSHVDLHPNKKIVMNDAYRSLLWRVQILSPSQLVQGKMEFFMRFNSDLTPLNFSTHKEHWFQVLYLVSCMMELVAAIGIHFSSFISQVGESH